MSAGKCRFCGAPLARTFVDLGSAPLSNAYLTAEDLERKEKFFPLHVYVCERCLLVQLEELASPEAIFSDYAYFSSYSDAWLKHAETYTDRMIERFGYGANSLVIELASNDGYLLQYFRKRRVPVLGIEPAANVAKVAEEKGIPTLVKFFGVAVAEELAKEGKRADLLLGNNVLAHVPDLNGFVAGMRTALKAGGVITMEFPHLLRLMENNQFDTIYHEHFSYFSFIIVEKVFARHGLTVFDVEELATHGGSLRIYARHAEDSGKAVGPRVGELLERERAEGFGRLETYDGFSPKVEEVRRNLLSFLDRARGEGRKVVGYGAAAKGNTLLNYCGIKGDSIEYVVDRSPHKQGRFLPGSHLPIRAPEHVKETKPAYLLILPWNIKDEVMEQMAYVREWGCKFVTPIPRVEVR